MQGDSDPEKSKRKILPDDSVCTSDASDLLSKVTSTFQSKLYHSLARKLREVNNSTRHLTVPQRKKERNERDLSLSQLNLPNNDLANDLVQQAATQHEAMKQISKALTLCRNTKEFSGSLEEIEGQRLLLIASYKRQALLSEIRKLDYDLDNNPSPSIETGCLTISGINFPLKSGNEGQVNFQEYNQWFVCLASYGTQIAATQMVLAKKNSPVVFPEEFSFNDLHSDFVINIEIFSLTQRQNVRNYSHDSKFHLNKSAKKSHCPKLNFLHRDKQAHKFLSRCDTGILMSTFKSMGSVKIKVGDISKNGPWLLRKVPFSSNVHGAINMTIKSHVDIPVKHSGFLTIGTKISNTISWNRRWCVLSSHLLHAWNYPCDEDGVEPLETIDLKKCVNAIVDVADRSVCPRPRTLLLETANAEDPSRFDTYFFQTDTLSEMRTWHDQINKIVSATRTWNDSYFSQL